MLDKCKRSCNLCGDLVQQKDRIQYTTTKGYIRRSRPTTVDLSESILKFTIVTPVETSSTSKTRETTKTTTRATTVRTTTASKTTTKTTKIMGILNYVLKNSIS